MYTLTFLQHIVIILLLQLRIVSNIIIFVVSILTELTVINVDSKTDTDDVYAPLQFFNSVLESNNWQTRLGVRSMRALGLGSDRCLDQELVIIVIAKPRGSNRRQFHPIR
jgi:hypothetical protein